MSNKDDEADFDREMNELWNGHDAEIEKAKRALLSHYAAQQNSQGTRLIGFVAGLFALWTLTSNVPGLNQVFGLPRIPLITDWVLSLPPWAVDSVDLVKVAILFFGTSIILFYILRTIFRHSVFGLLSVQAMWVTRNEVIETVRAIAKSKNKKPLEYEHRELFMINFTCARIIYQNNKLIYWKIPVRWFFPITYPECPSCVKTGYFFLAVVALFIAFLLLVLLW